jgi:hypothetical protein
MIVGFTGTQAGMTKEQHIAVRRLLRTRKYSELHHGGCVGADEQMHELWLIEHGDLPIIVHPASGVAASKKALLSGYFRKLAELPPLERNRVIVDACDLLIATPFTADEVLRSGTWATIRYARRTGKALTLVKPRGKLRTENT